MAMVSVVSKLANRFNGGQQQHDERMGIPTTIVAVSDTSPTARNGDCGNQLVTEIGATTVTYTVCSTVGCEGTTRIMDSGKPGFCLECRATYHLERAMDAVTATFIKFYPELQKNAEAELGIIEGLFEQGESYEVLNRARALRQFVFDERTRLDDEEARGLFNSGIFPGKTLERIRADLYYYRRQAEQAQRTSSNTPRSLPSSYLAKKKAKADADRELRERMKGSTNGSGKRR